MTFKWDRDLPYPSYRVLGERMGITEKMARRYAQSLEKKGYLRRLYQNRGPNKFDLGGLFAALASMPGYIPGLDRNVHSEGDEIENFLDGGAV